MIIYFNSYKILYLEMNQSNNNIYKPNSFLTPSILGLWMTGILILVFIITYFYYSSSQPFSPYQKIIILLLFTFAIGIHSLLHLGVEATYNYIPFQSKLLS